MYKTSSRPSCPTLATSIKNNEITNGLLPRVLVHHKEALPAFTCYILIIFTVNIFCRSWFGLEEGRERERKEGPQPNHPVMREVV